MLDVVQAHCLLVDHGVLTQIVLVIDLRRELLRGLGELAGHLLLLTLAYLPVTARVVNVEVCLDGLHT